MLTFSEFCLRSPRLAGELIAACGGDRAEAAATYDAVCTEAAETVLPAERERVAAHLDLASAAGDVRLAIEPIRSGSTVEQARATYLERAAGVRRLRYDEGSR